MVKFLDGSGVQASLPDLIQSTEKELFIISPHLRISPVIRNYLAGIDRKKIPISIIYGSDARLNDDDRSFFSGLNHLKIYNCDNLHARCFMNENMGIISTTNLHDHSPVQNWEMAIRFSRKEDQGVYHDVTRELRLMGPHLKKQSIAEMIAESRATPPVTPARRPESPPAPAGAKGPEVPLPGKNPAAPAGEKAHCIHCGLGLKTFDLQNPLCDRCRERQARGRTLPIKEKFCHRCGDPIPITSTAPLCESCSARLTRKR